MCICSMRNGSIQLPYALLPDVIMDIARHALRYVGPMMYVLSRQDLEVSYRWFDE